jgi:hypothetical protein
VLYGRAISAVGSSISTSFLISVAAAEIEKVVVLPNDGVQVAGEMEVGNGEEGRGRSDTGQGGAPRA